MGTKADTILDTSNLSNEELYGYSLVVQICCSYFVKKANIIYVRAKFNWRYQHDNELVSDLVTVTKSRFSQHSSLMF